jgi:hypothetical protein
MCVKYLTLDLVPSVPSINGSYYHSHYCFYTLSILRLPLTTALWSFGEIIVRIESYPFPYKIITYFSGNILITFVILVKGDEKSKGLVYSLLSVLNFKPITCLIKFPRNQIPSLKKNQEHDGHYNK